MSTMLYMKPLSYGKGKKANDEKFRKRVREAHARNLEFQRTMESIVANGTVTSDMLPKVPKTGKVNITERYFKKVQVWFAKHIDGIAKLMHVVGRTTKNEKDHGKIVISGTRDGMYRLEIRGIYEYMIELQNYVLVTLFSYRKMNKATAAENRRSLSGGFTPIVIRTSALRVLASRGSNPSVSKNGSWIPSNVALQITGNQEFSAITKGQLSAITSNYLVNTGAVVERPSSNPNSTRKVRYVVRDKLGNLLNEAAVLNRAGGMKIYISSSFSDAAFGGNTEVAEASFRASVLNLLGTAFKDTNMVFNPNDGRNELVPITSIITSDPPLYPFDDLVEEREELVKLKNKTKSRS